MPAHTRDVAICWTQQEDLFQVRLGVLPGTYDTWSHHIIMLNTVGVSASGLSRLVLDVVRCWARLKNLLRCVWLAAPQGHFISPGPSQTVQVADWWISIVTGPVNRDGLIEARQTSHLITRTSLNHCPFARFACRRVVFGEVLAMTQIPGGGGMEKLYQTLHCHYQNDLCIKMGSDAGQFNSSFYQ